MKKKLLKIENLVCIDDKCILKMLRNGYLGRERIKPEQLEYETFTDGDEEVKKGYGYNFTGKKYSYRYIRDDIMQDFIPLDTSVINAVLTLYYNGIMKFTELDMYRLCLGIFHSELDKRRLSSAIRQVSDSLSFLSNAEILIDVNGKSYAGKILPLVKEQNKWVIEKEPVLYTYILEDDYFRLISIENIGIGRLKLNQKNIAIRDALLQRFCLIEELSTDKREKQRRKYQMLFTYNFQTLLNNISCFGDSELSVYQLRDKIKELMKGWKCSGLVQAYVIDNESVSYKLDIDKLVKEERIWKWLNGKNIEVPNRIRIAEGPDGAPF